MTQAHRTLGEHFATADLATDRFVTVKDGAKMCTDHDSRWSDPDEVPGTNYGIYADEGDRLLVLDVDVHRDDESGQIVPVAALSGLPDTLEIQSPHVDEESPGGHRMYRLAGDRTPAELFNDVFGKKNPVPSWGEVIAKNKYVVGPGSQLDGCDKDWCDRCATSTGGRYTIQQDQPIATVDPDDLVEALAADPDLTRQDQNATLPASTDSSQDSSTTTSDAEDYPDLSRDQVKALLEEIPGTQHFDDWIRTGYAVLSWDDTDTGKEVFKEWSKENEDWESPESQRQIDYIWSSGDADGDGDGRAGVGTLVQLARDHGDPDVFDGQPPSSKSTEELIAEHHDEFDSAADVPDDLVAAIGPGEDSTDTGTDDEAPSWSDVLAAYRTAEAEQDVSRGTAREMARRRLEHEYDWMYVRESEQLWVYDDDSGTFNRWGEEKVGQILREELEGHYARSERGEVVAGLCDGNQVSRENLNARHLEEPLLCVGNGVVNLDTGDLLDHSPEYRFVRGLRWNYPTAENGLASTPDRVLEFLDNITERPEDRDTFLDHLAHGLMPGHPYRAFVVCYGEGGNGKTQIARLFRRFVGEENAASVEIDELVNDDFATGDLPGKFINWGDDMTGDGGGTLEELSTLKKASGGSSIRANEKYEKTFDFKNEAALFFSANEPPRLGESKKSVKDRLYPIHLPYEFSNDPDPDDPMEKQKVSKIADRLAAQDDVMRGLLELAVEHAQDLRERDGEYSQPETPQERWERYTKQADPLARFVRDALEPAPSDKKIRKDDAYRVYTSFVEAWSERAASERGFKRQLPRTVSEEVETARSRQLATPGDDDDRVWTWSRLTWKEPAREHMPDWMAERYADHFDTAEDQDGGNDGEDTDTASSREEAEPLAALDPQYGADIDVTVRAVSDGEYNRAEQGRLCGPQGTYIGYVVPGGNDATLAAQEGEDVRLEGVTLRTDDDGLLEAVVDDAVAVVADGDDAADSSGDTATADGGTLGDIQNVTPQVVSAVRRLDESGDYPDGVPPEAIKEAVDAPAEAVEHGIEKATKDGTLYQPTEGHYRPT